MSIPSYQPDQRPPEYPASVLWTLAECLQDHDAGVSEQNKSRPPMDKVIRNQDGTMITHAEWEDIKTSARVLRNQLLSLPHPKRCADAEPANNLKRKRYFTDNHGTEWQRARTALEKRHPILTLCNKNWKADHVLASMLRSNTHTSLAVPNSKKRQRTPSSGSTQLHHHQKRPKNQQDNNEMMESQKGHGNDANDVDFGNAHLEKDTMRSACASSNSLLSANLFLKVPGSNPTSTSIDVRFIEVNSSCT